MIREKDEINENYEVATCYMHYYSDLITNVKIQNIIKSDKKHLNNRNVGCPHTEYKDWLSSNPLQKPYVQSDYH
jgi:hypothetical protein